MQNFQRRTSPCNQLAIIFNFTWQTPIRLWLKYHRCLSCSIFEIFHFILQIFIAKFVLRINTYRSSKSRNERKLKEKNKDGTYKIGSMIVPQKYQRTVFNGDKIEKEIVEVSGRKINILDVRKTILKWNKWKIHENFYWWAVRKNVLYRTNEWI